MRREYIQTKHEGNASFVSFVDYLAGIGYYWPSLPHNLSKEKQWKQQQEDDGRLHEHDEWKR